MKKAISLFMAVVLMLGILAGCSSSTQDTPETTKAPTQNETPATTADTTPAGGEEEVLEIGIVCPLSSTHAATNGWLTSAFETAAKIINEERGGIVGRKVHYSLYDPESDSATLKQRLTDIKNSGAICALAVVNDALAPAAAQWASENSFPVFLTANTSTQVTLGNYSDYAFSVGKNAWGFAKVLALHCVGEEGKKNFCFVGTDGAATIDAENFLIYEGQKIDPEFEMLASYRIGFNDTEFSNVIAAATSKQPEMILQQGGGPNFVAFCQQASLFGLFDYCDVYNDLVTDASTNQPLIEGNEFPYGHTNGIFNLPFWDKDLITGDLAHFIEVWNTTDFAKEGWLFADNSMLQYYIWTALEQAVTNIINSGADVHDPETVAKAIAEVSWTDCLGEHHFRVGLDNQLTVPMFFGTSAQSDEWPGVAICEEYDAYEADEYLPTAEEMKAWGLEHGYDVSRFN